MGVSQHDVAALLDQAARGSGSAVNSLLTAYRPHLLQLIAARIDTRLSGRVDPSDVVQDVLAVANDRMSKYLSQRPLPFYLWLRRLALDQLSQLHRRHVRAKSRSVKREGAALLSDDSLTMLADQISTSSPSQIALRDELQRNVGDALNALSTEDRELLIMKYVEQLTLSDIAAAMGTSLRAAKARHLRALRRMGQRLAAMGDGQ